MNRYVEIRCCCEPGKLLGYLPVSSADVGRSKVWQFIERNDGRECRTVSLEAALIWDGEHAPYWAFKSGDRTVEQLSRIRGFVPFEVRR